MAYFEEIEEHTKEDAEGNITTDIVKKTKSIKKNDEPDYIKIYTRMWCEFNEIPEKWKALFMTLVCRMSYPDESDEGGQIVYTISRNAKEILASCGWKNINTLYQGLKALQECNAIRKIGKGMYQINPQYAGKGSWHYNPQEKHGGVANLIAKFNFQEKTVDTKIIWASTEKKEIGHNLDEVIATRTTITPNITADEEWEEII